MSRETAGPAETSIPCVAIVSDYRNVAYAAEYEKQLFGLGFGTEWVVDSELLQDWADKANAATPGQKAGVVRHPYSYSMAYQERLAPSKDKGSPTMIIILERQVTQPLRQGEQ